LEGGCAFKLAFQKAKTRLNRSGIEEVVMILVEEGQPPQLGGAATSAGDYGSGEDCMDLNFGGRMRIEVGFPKSHDSLNLERN